MPSSNRPINEAAIIEQLATHHRPLATMIPE
jgi:hypothetical protein